MANEEVNRENPELDRVFEAIGALSHGAFDVLAAPAREDLDRFLAIETHARKVGEFTIQFYLDSDETRLADPDWVSWVALLFNFVKLDDQDLMLEFDCLYPKQKGLIDISDSKELKDRPTHVVQWPQDIENSLTQAWRIAHDAPVTDEEL